MDKPTREQVQEQVKRYNEVLDLMGKRQIPVRDAFGQNNRDKAMVEQAALLAFLNGADRDGMESVVIEESGIDPTSDDADDADQEEFDNLLYAAEDAWDWANGDSEDADPPADGWMALRR